MSGEMRELVAEAVRMGFELRGNEADRMHAPPELRPNTIGRLYTNWRERRQADNLAQAFMSIPDEWKLMVWC